MEVVVYADKVYTFFVFNAPVVSVVLLVLCTLGCYFWSPSDASGGGNFIWRGAVVLVDFFVAFFISAGFLCICLKYFCNLFQYRRMFFRQFLYVLIYPSDFICEFL